MHPDGFMCLVCQTRTKSEGQLCPACVEACHRVENGMLLFNFEVRVPDRRHQGYCFPSLGEPCGSCHRCVAA